MRWLALALALAALQAAAQAPAPRIAAGLDAALARGEAVRAIVLIEHAPATDEARRERAAGGLRADDARIRAQRASRHRALKAQLAPALDPADTDLLRDYPNLPILALRLRSRAALARLAARPEVKAVYEDRPHYPNLAQSLPLVSQPATTSAGYAGAGTTVAVVDTAVDYMNAAFGCSAPGVPAGCKVAAAVAFVADTPPADDNSHGTNVAAIVLAVAPGARVASLDVFNNGVAYGSAILDALDWAIANRDAYNIVAINMSLGDASSNAAACDELSPFTDAISQARDAGILTAAAAGNNGYSGGISGPACVSSAVSVGAVYDSAFGGITWSSCADTSTAADKVVCFSNSAPILTMLAPGALITAAGLTFGGTSQAAPHVAGAIAVLRAAFPTETTAQTVARLTSSGVAVTDPRNGLVRPRLSLEAAARPANDGFTARALLSGNSGSATGGNRLATPEAAEPAHAGQSPSSSVWWSWTAPSSGQARFDTAGSGIDTLLAAYTGGTLAALAPVAANDDAPGLGGRSRILFQATAGTEYLIAVDGKSAATGTLALNWDLNTAARADVSVTLDAAPDPVLPGADLVYTLTVANAGPQSATAVVAALSLPAAESLKFLPSGCTGTGTAVNCAVAELAAGASVQFAITATVNAAGTLVAQAEVTAATPDVIASNNAGSDTTTAQSAGAPVEGDVPLPAWSLGLMGALLYGAWRRQAVRSRRA
jgi:subtilisin family serine protease